jgi:hypothetical protein
MHIADQPIIASQPDQDPTFELEATLLDLVRVVACQSKFDPPDPSVAQALDRLRLLAERLS